MKRKDFGLCSIQEYNRLKTSIFDAVDEWLIYYLADPATGLAIDMHTLCVEVCNKKDAKAHEWIPLESLAREGEADATAILDLADRLCFVR